MCVVEVPGRVLLASVGDAAVRLWDADTGARHGAAAARSAQVTALAVVCQGNRELVACGRGDGLVHLRGSATGDDIRVLTGHTGPVSTLSSTFASGDVILASGSTDHTVGVWTLNAARQRPHLDYRPGWSDAVAAVVVHRQVFLAGAGLDGTVRLWDPYTGKERRRRTALPWSRRSTARHTGGVAALCAIPWHSGTRVATAGRDGTVRIWNADTGRQELIFGGHAGGVLAVCPIALRGRTVIASAGDDQVVQVWDAATADRVLALQGHTNRITALCTVRVRGRTMLASAGHDRTVRLWNLTTGALELTIPVHHEATACAATTDCLIVGLTAGTLAISLALASPHTEPVAQPTLRPAHR
jgi:WD40 repeat protein